MENGHFGGTQQLAYAPCLADMLPASRLFSMVWMHQHNSISNCCVASLVLAVAVGGAGDVSDVLVLVLTTLCVTVFSAARLLRLLDVPLVSWSAALGLAYTLFMFFNLPVLL